MEKKKVYLISQTYPTTDYGDTMFINNEIGYLRDRCDITVLCLGNLNAPKVPHEGIKCVYLDYSIYKTIQYIPFFLFSRECYSEISDIICNYRIKGRLIQKFIASIRMFAGSKWFEKKVRKTVSTDEEAVFYSFWADFPIIALLRMKSLYPRCRFISRIHGYELYDEQDKSGRVSYRRFLNERIDKLVFIGENPRKYYLEHHPDLELKKVHLCRLGITPIDGTKAVRYSNDMLIVSCSSVIPLKRVDLIVRALSQYDNKASVKWIHFGDGPLMTELRREAESLLDRKRNVSYELRGYVDNEEIRRFYADTIADCFITTSSTEGCPVSVMEVLSVGTPIIGTSVGDIPHMIQGNGVLLSENPSVDQISEAISKMAEYYSEKDLSSVYSGMRKRSKELFAEMFDAKVNSERFMSEVLED